jgi:hypothetical protein
VARFLTFQQLRSEKGWPHSRQHTHRLAKAGKIPAPRKRPDGGSRNLWIESEWDAFCDTFVSAHPAPTQPHK